MDDTSIKDSLRGFDSVWERVGGAPAEESGSAADGSAGESERLRSFLLSAVNAHALYSQLARRFKGAAPVLMRLAAEERGHVRALALEYYLLTGDSFAPPAAEAKTDGLLSALRSAWQAEGRSEQSYLHAASISSLGPLYRAHAENERRHRVMLRELIYRSMQ